MTNRGPGAASEWVDGDVLYSDDLLDSLGEIRYISILNGNLPTSFTGLIRHASATYSAVAANGTVYQSTDTCASWTSRSTILDTTSFIRLCRNDATRGFAVESSATAETVITTDSGATWTAATSVTWGAGGSAYDLSYPVSTLIVVGGDDGATTNFIKRSTDGGTTWANAAASPLAIVVAVGMLDGTTGFALDSAGNIWRTTDGADNWTDTTHNSAFTASPDNSHCSIYALTTTTALIFGTNGGALMVESYDFTAGTVTVTTRFPTGDVNLGYAIKSNNEVVTGAHRIVNLTNNILKSASNGAAGSWRLLPAFCLASSYAGGGVAADRFGKCSLTNFRGGNNIAYVVNQRFLVEIMEGD